MSMQILILFITFSFFCYPQGHGLYICELCMCLCVNVCVHVTLCACVCMVVVRREKRWSVPLLPSHHHHTHSHAHNVTCTRVHIHTEDRCIHIHSMHKHKCIQKMHEYMTTHAEYNKNMVNHMHTYTCTRAAHVHMHACMQHTTHACIVFMADRIYVGVALNRSCVIPMYTGQMMWNLPKEQKEIWQSSHAASNTSAWYMEVGIDLIELPQSRNGNRYCITLTDYFSKWSKAEAIPTKEAKHVAAFLYKMILCHGHPEEIVSDQGREFCNQLIDILEQFTGFKHKITSA